MTYSHFYAGNCQQSRRSAALSAIIRHLVLVPRPSARASLKPRRQHFAEHGYHAARVGDIAIALGIAKGSIFQHFGSKDGLFFEVYKRAVRSFPKYLDAPAEIRSAGFFEVLRYWLVRTEHLVREDWIPYRISLLGNYGTDLVLKREINRFLITRRSLRHGGLCPLRTWSAVNCAKTWIIEMIVSILDWMMERFQDALLTAELDPGLFRRQGEAAEKKEARIQQFLAVLKRAIGSDANPSPNGRASARREIRR